MSKKDQNVEENTLKQEAVAKNPFALLSMYLFLGTLVVTTVIAFVAGQFHLQTGWLDGLALLGYGLSILSEIVAMVVSAKIKNEDSSASGSNYGVAAMLMSIFVLLAKFVG